MRQQSDGISAGAEEGGVAERDDAGIAECEIEREREQDRDQEVGAEAEIVREREIEGERQEPRQRLPRPQPMAFGKRQRRRMLGETVRRCAHAGLPPNRPCGRHNSNRIVST